MDEAILVSRGSADVVLQVCGSVAGRMDALGFSSSSDKPLSTGRGTRFPFEGLQGPYLTSVMNLTVGNPQAEENFW